MQKFLSSKLVYSVILALTLIVIFQAVVPLYAEEEESVPVMPIGMKCKNVVADAIKPRRVEFAAFINTHFKNEAMTSDLLPQAIEAYRRYREEIFKAVDDFSEVKAGIDPKLLVGEKEACLQFANDELFVIREVLKQHAVKNAQAKKSTRLLDRYKEINDKLEDLNFQMAQMFGYFEVFNAKLPCVTEKCVQK